MTWVRNPPHKLLVACLRVLIGASLLVVILMLMGMFFLVKMLLGRRFWVMVKTQKWRLSLVRRSVRQGRGRRARQGRRRRARQGRRRRARQAGRRRRHAVWSDARPPRTRRAPQVRNVSVGVFSVGNYFVVCLSSASHVMTWQLLNIAILKLNVQPMILTFN